jgi:hypothetical protein
MSALAESVSAWHLAPRREATNGQIAAGESRHCDLPDGHLSLDLPSVRGIGGSFSTRLR